MPAEPDYPGRGYPARRRKRQEEGCGGKPDVPAERVRGGSTCYGNNPF